MPASRVLLAAALLLACGAGRPAAAQEAGDGARAAGPAPIRAATSRSARPAPRRAASDSLRIGLALSGGSARGFAHVGVLRALEAMDVPVHAVAGVSMGAVVGALHSVGYGADTLERLAVDQDWGALFSGAGPPGVYWPWSAAEPERHVVSLPLRSGRPTLPIGLVAGQQVTQLLTRLTWHVHPTRDFRRLPVPFVALATDLETGEAVPLERGFLPLALRASLAIPSLFTPVRIDGRYLVDGGVSRNLPAEDVRRLGVDVVVCSDVTEPLEPADSLRTFVDVLTQTVSFRTVREAERQRELCDVVVRPELAGPGTYAFDRAATWIARGDSAARARRDTLRALAVRARPAPGRPQPPALDPAADSVVVTDVRFPGLAPGRARYLRSVMGLAADGPASIARVDREVGRLYDVGLFSRVTYRLDAPTADSPGGPARAGAADGSVGAPPRRALVVETAPEGRRELRAGLRFDSHREAALLLTADLRRLPGFGSAARLDARLGEQLHFEARQRFQPTFAPGFLLAARAGYRRTPLEPPAAGGAGELDVASEVVEGGLMAARLLGRRGVIGVEGGAEWYEVDPRDDAPVPEPGGWLVTASASAALDTRDDLAFPQSGVRLDLRLEAAAEPGDGNRELVQSWGDLEGHVHLGERWSARARATVGSTSGDPPPLHRAFFLGGAVPDRVAPRRRLTLPGLAPHELRGEVLQRAEAGLRVRVGAGVHLSAGWTGGDVRQAWGVDPSSWIHGFDVGAGVDTPFGPVRLVVAHATGPGEVRVAVDAGGQF